MSTENEAQSQTPNPENITISEEQLKKQEKVVRMEGAMDFFSDMLFERIEPKILKLIDQKISHEKDAGTNVLNETVDEIKNSLRKEFTTKLNTTVSRIINGIYIGYEPEKDDSKAKTDPSEPEKE